MLVETFQIVHTGGALIKHYFNIYSVNNIYIFNAYIFISSLALNCMEN